MERIDKTVFVSYRRTNAPWALAVSQNLTFHGYDVFFDFNGIASGDFESVILGNIRARAHFIVLLTPSALERTGEPGDWLRREIETALEIKRNIVPLMLEGFDFNTPTIASQLTGKLATLRSYNALRVPVEFFEEAMDRLCKRYLNIALDTVLHPASPEARQAAVAEQAAVSAAPAVTSKELTAQEWFERGFNVTDADEKIHYYSEAIRLKHDYPEAYYNRGLAKYQKGDMDGALADSEQAISLRQDYADYFTARGNARKAKSDLAGALKDYDEAIRLKPSSSEPFYNRGIVRRASGDTEGALRDYDEAIRLKPEFAYAFYNRAQIWKQKDQPAAAIADYQKYLDLGGGERDGDTEQVKGYIRDLKNKL